jgi:hypothetical protein
MVGARARRLTAVAAARRGAYAHAWLLLERLPCVDRSRHSRRTNRFLAPGRTKGRRRSSVLYCFVVGFATSVPVAVFALPPARERWVLGHVASLLLLLPGAVLMHTLGCF